MSRLPGVSPRLNQFIPMAPVSGSGSLVVLEGLLNFDIQVILAVYRHFAGIGLVGDYWDPQADIFG